MSISVNISAAGAIPDRDTLISAVQEELDRDDLTDKIPQFIQFVEAKCNRKLRTPDMIRTVIGTASNEDTALPEDYLAMRSLYQEGSPDRPLRAMSATAIRHGYDGGTGTPVAYTLVGSSIRLIPPPADEISLAMDYWARIEPLSVYAPTNWLLEKHPDAYLYGVLYRAEHHLKNTQSALEYKQLFDAELEDINRAARNDAFGAGPIAPTIVSQVRGAKC